MFAHSVICSLFHQFVENLLAFSLDDDLASSLCFTSFFVLLGSSFIHYRLLLFLLLFFLWMVLKSKSSWKCPKGSRTNYQTERNSKNDWKKAKHSTRVRFSSDICPRMQCTRTYHQQQFNVCVVVCLCQLSCGALSLTWNVLLFDISYMTRIACHDINGRYFRILFFPSVRQTLSIFHHFPLCIRQMNI